MDFNTLTGPELVAAFNGMADSTTGREVGLKRVERFADRAAGIARCEKARSSIHAWVAGQAEEDARRKVVRQSKQEAPRAPQKKEEAVTAEVRAGSNREKLFAILQTHAGQPKKLSELAQELYGDAEKTGPLTMVLKGLEDVFTKKAMPFKIARTKNGREVSIDLQRAA